MYIYHKLPTFLWMLPLKHRLLLLLQSVSQSLTEDRKSELRDELSDLDVQESNVREQLAEAQENAQAELNRIQTERRELIDELLGDSVKPDALELTPEMADEAITTLKAEFDKSAEDRNKDGYTVQEGMDFAAVEKKLRAEENESVLASLYRMVHAGSRPAVVCEEGGNFCIAETFSQTLSERANCVYDRKAEKLVGKENCKANAVAQAQKMGVPLMERDIAKAHLVRFPNINHYCYDYIQATKGERNDGYAPYIYRDGGGAGVGLGSARDRGGSRGWRGALGVY